MKRKMNLLQLFKDNARAEGPAAIRMDATTDTEAHIYLSDVIDAYWGANATALITALAGQQDKTVYLHINSPGGDVFEARAMAAAVVAHPGAVVARIDGICASAATYVALACNEVRMTDGGLFMIHNSWTFAMGDKAELRSTADLLDKIDGTIIADYKRKCGASQEQVVAWMDATTWFTAQEALDAKLIDAIDPNTKQAKDNPAAKWNLAAYPNAPKLAAGADTCGAVCPECGAACCGSSKCPSCGCDCSSACDCPECGAACCGYASCPDCNAACCSSAKCVPDTGSASDKAKAESDADHLSAQVALQLQSNRNRMRLLAPI